MMRSTRTQQQPQQGPATNFGPIIGGTLIALGIAVMLLGFVAFGSATYEEVVKAPPPPQPIAVDAPGSRTVANAGCELSNGWAVCNNSDGARFLDFFKRAPKATIGRALSEYDPVTRQQVFDFLVLGFDPNETNRDFQVQPLNLGNDDLAANGRSPVNNPTWHDAVRDFIQGVIQAGGDPVKIFGRPISEPICNASGCSQWSNRSRFDFPQGAKLGKEVKLAPLGRMTKRPDAPQPQQPDQVVKRPLPLFQNVQLIFTLILAAILAGVGAFLFSVTRGHETQTSTQQGGARRRLR